MDRQKHDTTRREDDAPTGKRNGSHTLLREATGLTRLGSRPAINQSLEITSAHLGAWHESGIGRLTPVIAALVFLPVAPSLALGIGIDWLLKGVGYLTYPGGDGYPLWTVEFLGCLPVVLLAVGVYRHAATSAARGEKT